ncbi:uncharacterized protein LOC118644315 [Monomorium pharaonis]|uniref:uncharacterized protein LOC118644315 n=1 Tax=Monomorium pharaonis TaxID=307658 RepID=UPI0017476B70|nr:uncharacterized protein LOC118644315 [Monomorium pharaonis]
MRGLFVPWLAQGGRLLRNLRAVAARNSLRYRMYTSRLRASPLSVKKLMRQDYPAKLGKCLTTGEKRSIVSRSKLATKSVKSAFPFGCNCMQMHEHARDYT